MAQNHSSRVIGLCLWSENQLFTFIQSWNSSLTFKLQGKNLAFESLPFIALIATRCCVKTLYMYYPMRYFPGGSEGKESTHNEGDLGSVPGLGRSPGEGHGNPLQYSCLENPHGQRSLVGYSPRGREELDTTEQLSTAQHVIPLKPLHSA